MLPRQSASSQGVGGFARLADRQGQQTLFEQGIAVAKLMGIGHLAGDAGQLLEQDPADQAGVVGGATGGDPDPVHSVRALIQPSQPLQSHPFAAIRTGPDPGTHGSGDHFGLFVDFLFHEMVEAALEDGIGLPVNRERLLLDRVAGEGFECGPGLGDGDDLAVLYQLEPLCVLQNGRDVGSQEGFVFS